MQTFFDPLNQNYVSRRYPLYARGGMVNCSSPLAAAAGLDALKDGGNAMDAAVAAAAALTVVEPVSNGIGSDAFALIWSEKEHRLFGLNSSGPSPAAASAARVLSEHRDVDGKMPAHGWIPVTVPGAPKAWAEITGRFGRRSLSENLRPAVRYARDGYPCAPVLSMLWNRSLSQYRESLKGPEFDAWFRTFEKGKDEMKPGDMIFLPDHADSLELIGRTGSDAFYRGELAEKIDAESRKYGGYLRREDLEAYEAVWTEPIRLNYRGYEVCEIPPNGQGIAALTALNVLKEFEFDEKDSDRTVHLQLEAMKMAFADVFAYVSDPKAMRIDPACLLDPEYGAFRAGQIGERAVNRVCSDLPKSGTVYLCCADAEGNMVSYIQSNYMGFGSGIVVDGTGIALQNRGADFSLDPHHVNVLEPRKRTYHTIIPGFLMKDKEPVGPFGVMGGYMQPQGHVQVVMNYVDFHMNPQQALNAPRWQWLRDGRVAVETGLGKELAAKLAGRGHDIYMEPDSTRFGRGQMIVRLDNGVLVGGTEPRTDSNIACF